MKKLFILLIICLISPFTLVQAMPLYTFQIEGPNGLTATARSVSGMNKEVQIIEYRHSNSSLFSTIKMPGIAKYGNITITGMTVYNSGYFWRFMDQIRMNTVARGTWTISLMDQEGNVKIQWKLLNAWPTQIQGPDLANDASTVNISVLELAHEQLIVANDP